MKNTQVARLLAYVTGMVNQQVLLQNEYLAAENNCRGKAPGEPYEGKLHVRFDEGVLETELWNGLRHRPMAKAAG